MPKTKLAGSFVALITPFNRDGSVDLEAFRALLKFQADHGTSAVLIMGSTGETSMLTPEEKNHIIVETAKMKTAAMPIFYGACPHCEQGKAVEVQLHAEWQGDPIMGGPVTFGDVTRVPEDDECACVLTPEQEQQVIDDAEYAAINAETPFIEPD